MKAVSRERISRVEHARAAREARGEGEAFFARGHPLARLIRAFYSTLCEALADYDLNLLFNQTADPDDPRSAFRKDYGALPRGHNHLQGKTRLIIITPTADDYPDFRAEIEQRVQG